MSVKYLWTEDQGAGLHFWQLANHCLFQNTLVVESKGSNQGILDAVRILKPKETDIYYLAFDIVYDNMDVVNKLSELKELVSNYPEQIILLDMVCFEYIILAFSKLVEWTGNGHKDAIDMREHILKAVEDHRINLDQITDERTRRYLMGFRQYSTERVLKSMAYLLTDGDKWSIKGKELGACWHKDCCILPHIEKRQCHLETMTGFSKITELLSDAEFQKISSIMR